MNYEEEAQEIFRALPGGYPRGREEPWVRGKMRPRVMQPGKTIPFRKWCHYHSTGGHSTNRCHTLRAQIEKLIRKGELQECVFSERNTQVWGSPSDHHGEGSKLSRKRKIRTEQEEKEYQQRLREPYGGYTSESSDESLKTAREADNRREGILDRASGRTTGLDLARVQKTARKSVPSVDWAYKPLFWRYAEPVRGEANHSTHYILQDR